MAYNFVAASNQYGKNTTTPITAAPLTMVGWFKTGAAHFGNILTLGDQAGTTSTNNNFALRITNTSKVRASTNAVNAETSASYSTGVWQHAAAVIAGATDRTVYLNGGNAVNNTTSATPSGVDHLSIGAVANDGGIFNPFDGDLAHVALWNVALTASEIASMARGTCPLRVRSASLKGYWPLVGAAASPPDLSIGQRPLTLTNAPTLATTNPRVNSLVFSAPLTTGATSADVTISVPPDNVATTGGVTTVGVVFAPSVGPFRAEIGGVPASMTFSFIDSGTQYWVISAPAHTAGSVPVEIWFEDDDRYGTTTLTYVDSGGGGGRNRMLMGLG